MAGYSREVNGTEKPASAAVMRFLPDQRDSDRLVNWVHGSLVHGVEQLAGVEGLKAVVLDIRNGLVSEDTTYRAALAIARSDPRMRTLCAIALLSTDFDGIAKQEERASSRFISMVNRAWSFPASLFGAGQAQSLYRITPFQVPIQAHFEKGWQDLLVKDEHGDLYIQGKWFGPMFD